MNQFVEECRREWRRLRIPASMATEMTAELEADLAEAQSEGVSPEELLGTDPRSFAASWAAARGVERPSRAPRAVVFASVAAFLALALTGTALALFGAPAHMARPPDARTIALRPPIELSPTAVTAVWVSAPPVPVPVSGGGTRTTGEILLIVGLTGATALSLLALWRRRALNP